MLKENIFFIFLAQRQSPFAKGAGFARANHHQRWWLIRVKNPFSPIGFLCPGGHPRSCLPVAVSRLPNTQLTNLFSYRSTAIHIHNLQLRIGAKLFCLLAERKNKMDVSSPYMENIRVKNDDVINTRFFWNVNIERLGI